MKKHVLHSAFSLVELIVVIAIIAILTGTLVVSFSGGADSARTAKCLSNMRSLAAACQTYGAATTYYPLAGSIEYSWVDEDAGFKNVKRRFAEVPGWVSWLSQGRYPNTKPTSHVSNQSSSMYSTTREEEIFSLTNGALWKYVSGSRDVYICPLHAKAVGMVPVWSYLMNANFGWDYSTGSKSVGWSLRNVYGDLKLADRTLLFAEVPFSGVGTWEPSVNGSGTDVDSVLQYKTSIKGNNNLSGRTLLAGTKEECIGVNHRSGKNLVAPVVFADGHTEKLIIPFTGPLKSPTVDKSNITDLTAWLCIGQDVSFDGKNYKKSEN